MQYWPDLWGGLQVNSLARTIVVAATGLALLSVVPQAGHASTPGQLSFSPNQLMFSDQSPGTSSTSQSSVVTNVGGSPVHIDQDPVWLPADSGSVTSPLEFDVSTDCAGATLAGGQSCTVTVTFRPTLRGKQTGVLRLYSDADNQESGITLLGNASLSKVTPTTDDWACDHIAGCMIPFSTFVGTSSKPIDVTLTVDGNSPVEFADKAFDVQEGYAHELKATSTCDGVTLNPDEDCILTVWFAPASVGRRGLITVTANSNAVGFYRAATLLAEGKEPTQPPGTPPEAPTDLRTASALTSVQISWTPASTPPGGSQQSFRVVAEPSGRTCSTSTNSCTVRRLDAETEYTFTVTAYNDWGGSPATPSIHASTLQDLATARITPTNSQVLAGQNAELSAAQSTSLSGKPVTFEWDPGTGTFTPGGPTWTGQWNTPGTHTIRVRVTSSTGQQDTATAVIDVLADQPTARLTPATSHVVTGQNVELSAAASTSLSGKPVTFEWDPGTGTFTPGGPTWTGQWNTPGTHTIRVRVTSSTGQQDVATAVVQAFPSSLRTTGISINGGLPYTNSSVVTLSLGWPALSQQVRLSNDGGFARGSLKDLASELEWRLDDSVGGKFTKIVYARFVDSSNHESGTYLDDIIFDNDPPTLTAVSASPLSRQAAATAQTAGTRQQRWVIRSRAKDNRTGVTALRVSLKKSSGAAQQSVAYKKKALVLIRPRKAIWVQVQDGATNWSPWTRAKIKRR